jgi:hypothetical protein
MGTPHRVSRATTAYRPLLALLLAIGLLLRPYSASPALASSIYFGDYGGDTTATFGANATVAITGDMAGGCIDTLGTYTGKAYVLPHGSVNPGARTALGETANAVIQSDFTDGLYSDETVGFTAPSGKLGTGQYDIILDVCADGFYDPGVDVIATFSVVIPVAVPPVSTAIADLKTAAHTQAQDLVGTAAGLRAIAAEAMFMHYAECVSDVLEDFEELGIGSLACEAEAVATYAVDQRIRALYGFSFIEQAERTEEAGFEEMADLATHYQSIANDPPDANYQQITMLPAVTPLPIASNDPLDVGALGIGNAAANEDALAQALLHAIERYQGAAAASDGNWALIQARAIRDYASDLAAQLVQSNAVLNADSAALQADPRPVDTGLASLENLRTHVASPGLTPVELVSLHNAGLSDSEISDFQTTFVTLSYAGITKAGQESNIAGLVAANTTAIAALQGTVTAMNGIISQLTGNAQVVDAAPVASAGGPYSGTAGVPITFTGSATSTSGIAKYEWDLHGQGTFADATGPTATATYTSAQQTLVGLRVTNAAGFTTVAYARLSVTDPNSLPQLGSFAPATFAVSVPPGTSQVFSAAASDPDGDSVSTQWQLDGTAVGTGASFTFSPTLAQIGPHEVTVTATDSSPLGGSVQQSWSVDVPKLATSLAVAPASGTSGGTTSLSATLTQGSTPLAGKAITFTLNGQGFANNTATTDSNGKGALAAASLAGVAAGSYASGVGASFAGDATDAAVSGTAALTVQPAAPTLVSIAVTPANPSITKGATQQFKATGTYSDHSTADLTSSVTWSSGATSVATVSTSGLATGAASGTSTITATSGSVSGSTTLTVTAPPPISIAVIPADVTIDIGATKLYKAVGTYADNSTADITSSVTWSSSNPAVATMTSAGVATGTSAGTTTIEATLGSISGSTGLTVTSAPAGTAAPGYAATTFAVGFTASAVGPIGLAFDTADNLFVMDDPSGVLYKFGPGGGIASPATQVGPGLGCCMTGITFGKDGKLYLARQNYSDVVELSPTTGAILRRVAGIPCATGIATDPLSGDLLVTAIGCASSVYRIANPSTAPVVSVYASPGGTDGITIAPDGTIYTETGGCVTRIAGTNQPQPPATARLSCVSSMDGIAVAANAADPGQPPFAYTNDNSGTIVKVDLAKSPPVQSTIFSGGTRGDFVAVGPDGCLYATQTSTVVKLTNADGTCSLAPTGALPRLSLAPPAQSSPAGTPVTLTATFGNVASPSGLAVTFTVTGPNARSGQVAADSSGAAAFRYAGTSVGTDTITATATVNGQALTSNPATVTWTKGTTAVAVTPATGVAGGTTNLSATLTVGSTPLAGKTITFTLNGQGFTNNTATTDSNGVATLSNVSLAGIAAGSYASGVGAGFAGDANAGPSSGTAALTVSAPAPADTTPPSCVMVNKGTNAQGQVYIVVAVQDTGSGLGSLQVTALSNATVTPAMDVNGFIAVTKGVTAAFDVTATKVDSSQGSEIAFEVKDVAGNVTDCDPVTTAVVRSDGKPVTQSVTGIAKADHKVTVTAGTQGLVNMTITVNGQAYKVHGLAAGQTDNLDVSTALANGANTVSVTTTGKPGASAILIFGNI